ncbi:MAG: hypothetical protein ACYCV5_02215 [Acidimicrobiales bacterium]|jgi:hypothetical protein
MAGREADAETGRGDHPERARGRLAGVAVPLGLLSLGAQFLLGMAVNLFVHLPPAVARIAEWVGNVHWSAST